MDVACCATSPVASSLPRRSEPSSLAFPTSLSSVFSRRAPPPPLVSVSRPRRTKSPSLQCKCLFGLGVAEMAVIAGVAALAFGPTQLPEIGRKIGKTVKGFEQAAKEFETELKKTPSESGAPSPEKELETSSTKESV